MVVRNKGVIYDTLSSCLRRAGFHKNGKYSEIATHGPLARYICFLFEKRKGIVFTGDLVRFKLLEPGSTGLENLLKALRESYLILWDPRENLRKDLHSHQVYAFGKLSEFLNKSKKLENVSQKEFIEASKKHSIELECNSKKIKDLEDCIRFLIDKIDPPFTEDKIKFYQEEAKRKGFSSKVEIKKKQDLEEFDPNDPRYATIEELEEEALRRFENEEMNQ